MMEETALLIAVAVAISLLAGLLTGLRVKSGEVGRIRSEAEQQSSQCRVELETAKAEIADLAKKNSALEASLSAKRENFEQQTQQLTDVKKQLEEKFQNLASDALARSQSSFLELAKQHFEKHQEIAASDLQKRQDAIGNLVKPIAETLGKYDKKIDEIEKDRREAQGSITQQLENVARAHAEVRKETSKLVNALRSAPKTRGRWGEHQLQNVLEMAGMTNYVDFVTEQTFQVEEGRRRPDAIIRLPGKRQIVVDAKTPMSAYLDAVDEVDETLREEHLVKHAKQLRHHMQELGSKAYWDALDQTPDFVVMFVPGENLFAAAVERDHDIFEDGVEKRVLIATPTTLIALAKAIAYGWRQEKISQNAKDVADLGRILYRRIANMGHAVVKLGKQLDSSVKSYNSLVGSLEGSVLPQARRFEELEVDSQRVDMPSIEPLNVDVREPRKDRDLEVDDKSDDASQAP